MLVVISGGSQGLGKFVAKEYAEQGHQVYIVARTEKTLQAAAAELGHGVKFIAADVSVASECERVFEVTGTPDLAVCCAGAASTGFFIEHEPEALAHNLAVVYNTALYFSHAALRSMAKARKAETGGGGAPPSTRTRRIVFVSSVVAVFPMIGYSAYAPAKAAIRALSDIVAQEGIEHGVEVAHVMPGSMLTPGFEQENLTKPEITRKIEGPSPAVLPSAVAKQVVRDLERGQHTVYTDTIGWVLGSSMMGLSPRAGWGVLQGLVGLLLVLFGRIVAWSIRGDIKKDIQGRQ